MNVFALDQDPAVAAQMQCDKHVVKMSIEYAQLLSTAHHLLGSDPQVLAQVYKPTHKYHPMTQWVMEHPAHYAWVYRMMVQTWGEYTYRYGKTHASSRMHDILAHVPRGLNSHDRPVPPPQCMPDEYKVHPASPSWTDTVDAYRQYYHGAKARFARWTKRDAPVWWTQPNGEEPNGGKLP